MPCALRKGCIKWVWKKYNFILYTVACGQLCVSGRAVGILLHVWMLGKAFGHTLWIVWDRTQNPCEILHLFLQWLLYCPVYSFNAVGASGTPFSHQMLLSPWPTRRDGQLTVPILRVARGLGSALLWIAHFSELLIPTPLSWQHTLAPYPQQCWSFVVGIIWKAGDSKQCGFPVDRY